MSADLVVLGVMAAGVAAVGFLMRYLGGAIRREKRVTNLALPFRSRIRDVAGASEWMGRQLRWFGYGTIGAALLLLAAGVAGTERHVLLLVWVWIGATLLWTLVVVAGARRYY